jgi:hypothetical protein
LPWWPWSLIVAVGYTAILTLGLAIADDLSWHAVSIYGTSSVVVGLFLGPTYARAGRQQLAVVEDLPEDKQRVAERASRGGSIPTAPVTHRGALSLTEHRLGVIERSLVLRTVMMSVCLLGGVALALYVSAWFAAVSVLLAAGIVFGIRQRAQYRRRVAVLADGLVR